MIRKIIYLSLLALLVSCGGDDGPPPAPEGAALVFPEENSECTTGIDINETSSQVTFRWNASKNTTRYTLSVINLNTNLPQTISTASTSASLTITKGAPYAWSVTSQNTESDQVASSETWLFYNAGSQTTYVPFPAQLESPRSGATVQKDIANEVTLEWAGADVDNDIDFFEVFFSETNPPETSVGVTNASTMELPVGVESGTVYYWQVITTDLEGNVSSSSVFDFKVL
ncbi:MAG: hypothetical protein JJ885_00060 [Muricauda sp.]|nr:hypothetical protein [Allomuricauda sp.]MBO6531780.1 hypothetical protein [Allomuricauda sp.]MBO6588326.1 hypothetical protein [Allomuricauda sp.]MBO6617951.1 hypothetical protein [Allomuricauda sp.]MBO6643038.1 hypothetical protein [Allomuricauda sp.]MBO6746286.1 hypothetical protein [Allomuricauda sp.]